jgi:hypothetical protein
MTFMITSLFCHCDKYLRETGLKEERFILAHHFRGFSSRMAGSIALGLRSGKYHGGRVNGKGCLPHCFMVDRKGIERQRERERRLKIPF